MANIEIVQQPQSPFDSIRHVDQDGEHWSARKVLQRKLEAPTFYHPRPTTTAKR